MTFSSIVDETVVCVFYCFGPCVSGFNMCMSVIKLQLSEIFLTQISCGKLFGNIN